MKELRLRTGVSPVYPWGRDSGQDTTELEGENYNFSGISPDQASLSVTLMQDSGQDRGWDPGAVFQYQHTPHLKYPRWSSHVESPCIFPTAITHLSGSTPEAPHLHSPLPKPHGYE